MTRSRRAARARTGGLYDRYPVAAKLSPFSRSPKRNADRRGRSRQSSPAMRWCSIRRARSLPGSIRSRSPRISAGAASGRSCSRRRRRRRRRRGRRAMRLEVHEHNDAAPSRATKSRAIGCSAGIAAIMTIAATRSASRSRSAPNRGGHQQPRLTPVRESAFMVDIAAGAVANRFDSGYDESRRA